jgi:hypothetical protein
MTQLVSVSQKMDSRQPEHVCSVEETSMHGKERSQRVLDQKDQEERNLLLAWKCVQYAGQEG